MSTSLIHSFTAVGLLTAILFCSCGSESEEDDRTVFRYNEAQNISSLDPAFSSNLENIWAVHQLFDGLVELDEDLKPIPCIAESWTISADGLDYTFQLRDDVYFHADPCFDGPERTVKAQDFVYSFERLLSDQLASPGRWVFDSVGEDGFEALGDHTLVIHLKEPFAPFLGILAMQYCSVVPEEAIAEYGADFRSHPVGTGPFHFAFWMENVALVLHKNKRFWQTDAVGESLPYLDAIKVDFVKDKGTAFLDFTKGKYDFMSGIHQSYKDELLTVNGDLSEAFNDKVVFQRSPFLFTEYLGILVDDSIAISANSALNDKMVRKALNYALDRKEMAKYLRNNSTFPAEKGFIPSGLPSYSEEASYGYPYDRQLAKDMLAEAGHDRGQGIESLSIATTSDYVDLCEYVQHEWGKLGIDVKIDVFPSGTHRTKVAQSQVGMFRKSWLADYPDAENFLGCFVSERASPNGPNYTHFGSTEFDSLYTQSISTTESEVRYDLYRRMDSLIMDEACVVPLFYGQVSHFMQPSVKGLETNALNLLDLKSVRITYD